MGSEGSDRRNILSFHDLSTFPSVITSASEDDRLAAAAPCDFDGPRFVIVGGDLWRGAVVYGIALEQADGDGGVNDLRDKGIEARWGGIQGIGVGRDVVGLVVEFLESLGGHLLLVSLRAGYAITTDGAGASGVRVVGTICLSSREGSICSAPCGRRKGYMGRGLGDKHVGSRQVILGPSARRAAIYGMRDGDAGGFGRCWVAGACVGRGGSQSERGEIWQLEGPFLCPERLVRLRVAGVRVFGWRCARRRGGVAHGGGRGQARLLPSVCPCPPCPGTLSSATPKNAPSSMYVRSHPCSARLMLLLPQIGEKILANRRASDAAPDATSFVESLRQQEAQSGSPGILSSEEEEEGHAQQPQRIVTDSDFSEIFESLRRCLDLRDKYMRKSKQRIGDNPKDFGGNFQGLSEDLADVSGVRPDADFTEHTPPAHTFEPWKIYPKPPPPHWHLTDKEAVSSDRSHVKGDEEFRFEECDIPGPHAWTFKLDEKGVYQVYNDSQGDCHILRNFIPLKA